MGIKGFLFEGDTVPQKVDYNFLENARSAKEVACSARENADEYTSQQLEIINYYADFVY